MNPAEREALTHAVDRRRRELNEADPTGSRHGTECGYAYGCRCGECRTAATNARHLRRLKVPVEERRAKWRVQKARWRQRQTTTVTLGGFITICRCDACRWWMEVK